MDYENYTGFTNARAEDIRDKLRSSNGIQYTEALFEETFHGKVADKTHKPLYSLKEYPTSETPSAYQIYMNSVDETDAAIKLVGSLSHWRKLCSLRWFLHGRKDCGFEGILQWRQDMWDRDRSAAKKVLMRLSSEGNVTAARSLDKMASDELIRLNKLTPPTQEGGQSGKAAVDDGLAFLDELGGK